MASGIQNKDRVERLAFLFQQMEKEFESLLEENADRSLFYCAWCHLLSEKAAGGQGADTHCFDECEAGKRVVSSSVWFGFKTWGRRLYIAIKAKDYPHAESGQDTWKFLRDFIGHRDGVGELNVSPVDITLLGSASLDRTARVWAADDSKPTVIYAGHRGAVNSIRFHPSDLLVLTASGDATCHLWKACSALSAAPVKIERSESEKALTAGPWSPLLDAKSLPAGKSISGAKGLATATGKDRKEPDASGGGGITSSPCGSFSESLLLAREDAADAMAPAMVVKAPVQTLAGHTGSVIAAEWIAGGQQAVSASLDGSLRQWQVETGTQVSQLHLGYDEPHYLSNMNVNLSSNIVGVSCSDGYFRIFDLKSPKASVTSVLAHEGPVTQILLPGLHVISGSDDKSVKIWDFRNLKTPISVIRCSSGTNRFSLSPSSNILAIPTDNRHTKIYDLQGNKAGKLRSQSTEGHHGMITSTAWSADETVVYTSSYDRYRSIIAWTTSESKEMEKEAREAAAKARRAKQKHEKEQKEAAKKQLKEVARQQRKEKEKEEKERREKEEREREERRRDERRDAVKDLKDRKEKKDKEERKRDKDDKRDEEKRREERKDSK